MPRNGAWINRTGRFARYSSGTNIPRYAVTVDVATTPWEAPQQFDALETDQQAQMKSQILSAAQAYGAGETGAQKQLNQLMQYIPGSGIQRTELEQAMLQGQQDAQEEFEPDGWWGAVTDGLGAIKNAGDWALDKGDALLEKVPFDDQIRDVAKLSPVGTLLRQSLWLSEQANEYGATVLTAASLSGDDVSAMFKGETWKDAHHIVEQNHLDVGQAGILAFFLDDGGDVLNDHERIMKLQRTSGLYNVSSLGLQMIATWKYDPLVVLGRVGGAAMRFRRGDLFKNAALRAPQIEQLAAGDRALMSRHTRTLYDRWNDEILPMARDPKVDGETFSRAFDQGQNVNGRVMAELVREVAGDERLENLAFRTFIGDRKALQELTTERAEISEKIDAIQNTHKPALLNDMSVVDEAIAERDAGLKTLFGEDESGQDTLFSYLDDDQKARIGVTAGDDWLDMKAETHSAKLAEIDNKLAGYATHEDWLNRMLAGTDQRGDPMNAVAAGMNTISAKTGRGVLGSMHQAFREGARWDKTENWNTEDLPKVSTWQSSWLSPVHTLWTVPRTWFLKHNNYLNLHDADGTSRAVSSWLDQLETVTGRYDPQARGEIIDRIGRASTDAQRAEIAQELDELGIRMVGLKYGLDPDSMKTLSSMLASKRRRGWQNMGEQSRYSTVTREDGTQINLFEWFDGENQKHSMKLPLDVTELQNSHMLINVKDVDWIVRRNRDLLGELDQAYQMSKAGKYAVSTRRMLSDMYIDVGTALNSIWKPLALVSIRWPLRVIGDEATRWTLLGANGIMRETERGIGNLFWNNGVARPATWRKERKGLVKTQDLREEPGPVADAPWDVIDTKMIGNPTGAIPFEAAELNRMNRARYDALSELQASRKDIYRKRLLDKSEAAKPLPPYMQKFEDRIAQAEKDGRGFIIDPLNEKAFRKGYATSIYPGRLRTLSERPTAEDFRRYVDDNLELFSNGRNRLGVWFDRQYGMWIMDVVRGHKGKNAALEDIRKAEQDHFYDVTDNFSRYVREEGPQIRKTGRQTEKFKTYDGKQIVGAPALGDIGNPNMYYSMAGSKGAMANLYGSATFAQENSRRSGFNGGYQVIEPENPSWAQATADYVNSHFRQSPVWQKMLAGQTDDQITAWMKKTPQGRELRQRIGPRGIDPDGYVQDMRLVLNQHLPTQDIRALAAQRELKVKDVEENIPKDRRHDVHGATLDHLTMQGGIADMYRRVTDKMYEKLGSMPTDKLVRHPMFASQYRLKLRNLVASTKSEDLTPQMLKAYENTSRNYALKQVRRYMFQLGDDFNGVRMFRFISPFFQAQVEVVERYLKLIGEHPETIGRLVGMANVTGGAHGPISYTVNEEGERTKEWDWNGSIVLQWPKSIIKHIPGYGEWAKVYDKIPVPTSSVNLILQGEQPYLPSAGPMVVLPAMKYYEHRFAEGHIDDVNSPFFKWLFPYGMPRDSLDAFLPAWGRRARTMMFDESKDPAFATEQAEVYRALMVDWEQGGGIGEKPTMADANRVVKKQYMVRMVSNFLSPAPINANTKYQFYIDQARKFYDKYGPIDGGKKFYKEYGATLYRYWQSSSDTYGDMPATLEAAQTYGPLKDLYEKAPMLAGILAGPQTALGEYNYDVYRWQLDQPIAPGSTQTLRRKLSPEEVLEQNNVSRGWLEWEKVEKVIRVELRNRGLTDISQDEELSAWKEQQLSTVSARNPGWEDAYRSRSYDMDQFLREANDVIWDKRLDNRIDIQGLRQYMVMREEMTTLLAQLHQSGQTTSSSLSATSDPIIAELNAQWKKQIFSLTSRNLLFAEVYDRWLSNDDLESARLL